MKAGLVVVLGLPALIVSSALAAAAVTAVAPVPVPADNGTPACANARQFLQEVNADIARYTDSVARANERERQAQATLAAAKPGQKASAKEALAQARDVATRLAGEGQRIQANVSNLAATAAAECMTAPPTAAETTAEFAVPADNGTSQCSNDRSQMISLLDSIGHLRDTEIHRELPPGLGLSDVARGQIELQIKRLTVQLEAIATKAAAACAAVDFSGTWTGTYTETSSTGCPGKTGPMTLTLTQTGNQISGSLTDSGYNLCPNIVDLHGSITGTISGTTATITSAYDNDAGTYAGTLTLNGKTLTYRETSGDSATLTRG